MRMTIELSTAVMSVAEMEEAIIELSSALAIRKQMLPPPTQQERDMALSGHKIDAIRLYRARTGCLLRDAKTVVDSIS